MDAVDVEVEEEGGTEGTEGTQGTEGTFPLTTPVTVEGGTAADTADTLNRPAVGTVEGTEEGSEEGGMEGVEGTAEIVGGAVDD